MKKLTILTYKGILVTPHTYEDASDKVAYISISTSTKIVNIAQSRVAELARMLNEAVKLYNLTEDEETNEGDR